MARVTPDGAREAFRAAMRTTILTQPNGIAAPADGFAAYPNLTAEVFPGRSFRNRAESAWSPFRRFPSIVVGETGVSLVAKDGTGFGIRHPDVAVAVQRSSGPLAVVHRNGTEIVIDPLHWVNASAAIDGVKARIPPDKLVHIDDGPLNSGPARSMAAWLFLTYAGVAAFGALSFASFAWGKAGTVGGDATLAALLGVLGAAGLGGYIVGELRSFRWAPLAGIAAFLTLYAAMELFYETEQGSFEVIFLFFPMFYLIAQAWRRWRDG